MALLTTTTVIINGKNIPYFERLTLSQSISDHHTLILVCRLQDLPLEEGTPTDTLGIIKTYTGARVSIAIAPPQQSTTPYYTKELLFKGVIMGITEEWLDRGHGQCITFTINAPTMLMDHSKKNASYLDLGIDDIISRTLQRYDADKLTADIRPTFYTPLVYTVQDHCSDFQFIKRLSAFYGQWCYYDGLRLIFGTPDTTTTPLEHGVNLKSMHLKLTPTATNIQFVTTDYLTDEVHEKDSSEVTTSAEYLQRDIEQRAKQLFHKKNTQYTTGLYTDSNLANRFERQIEQYIKAKSLNQVTLLCTSDEPGVQLGSIVHIKNQGRYRVTKVNHSTTYDGNYENSFEAIEASTEVYPMMDIYSIAKSESQTAIVKDTNDPKKLGRVKVQFPWQRKMGQTTPWIRVATPYAGADRGLYWIPEIKDEVMVQFEGGNAERPYVSHSLYNSIQKPNAEWVDPKNNTKIFCSKAGHTIALIDTKGAEKIQIKDKNQNLIEIDTANNNMTITAGADLAINATNITINATNDVKINAKNNIVLTAEEQAIAINAKQNLSLESSDAEVALTAKTNALIQSSDQVNLQASNELKAHGGAKSKLSGGKVQINQG